MKVRFKTVFASLFLAGGLHAQEVTVLEYCPAPGQFINTMPEATEEDTPQTMALKCTEYLRQEFVVCLGSFGGYITFHFGHPVVNQQGACDFLIKGNSFDGNAEPGIVMVSQDTNGNGLPDDAWYELSGSADEDSIGKVAYGYEITYTRVPMQNIPWTDNQGNSGEVVRNVFHTQEYFPLWQKADQLIFQGTRLPDNARDTSGKGSSWLLSPLRYGYADNLPNSDREGNSFNIEWAVDADRHPVTLTHIDFVRVYSAMNQSCGWIGETSTEIAGAEDLHLQASLEFAARVSLPRKPDAPEAVYSIGGQRLPAAQRGLNIIRYKDGTIHKLTIK